MASIAQLWQGTVESVNAETFRARLLPVADQPGQHGVEICRYEAEIYLSSVPDSERHLVVAGAVFNWAITDAGVSVMRFMRPAPLTTEVLGRARQRGDG